METRMLSSELELLLKTKNYEELNSEERYFVNQHITQDKYINFRKIIRMYEQDARENTLSSHPNEKEKLMDIFDRKHNALNLSSSLTIGRFTLPLYKAAIAAVVVLGTFFLIGWKASIEINNQAIIYLTDTIYKEVLVPEKIWLADSSTRVEYFKEDDNGKTTKMTKPINKLFIPKGTIEEEKPGQNYETARRLGIAPDMNFTNRRRAQKSGKSLKEDSVFSKFMVRVN